MLEVRNISKFYGDLPGVRNLSFSTEKGEILGLLGANGAGKTTAMNIITGYIPPTSGQVLLNGIDLHQSPLEAKKLIGYLPETPPLYPDLQVNHFLKFVCELKGVPPREIPDHLDEIMESVGLTDVKKRLIKNLSKGYRQRIGLAQALISKPDFIVLDEPTVGLDPKQIAEVRNLIKNIGGISTVILSSHILTEVNLLCDRVIIIDKGNTVAGDSPANLADRLFEYDSFFVCVQAPVNVFISKCQNIEGITKITHQETDRILPDGFNEYVIENDKSIDVRSPLFRMMAKSDYIAHEIKSIDIGLEDVFFQYTGKGTGNT
ncbi:MAG: ABC transporter ATP-binding protein [Spirochaetaceae bacterium]|jgi:ABC-2 type transport system ATP-binding protein|nr:ABC transporter ATP-binding protein [Spirochaetaceae bacterium]